MYGEASRRRRSPGKYAMMWMGILFMCAHSCLIHAPRITRRSRSASSRLPLSRRCWALVCVAVWTYAIIYFAALYSYRPSRVKINQ